jgi:hypothetical protein
MATPTELFFLKAWKMFLDDGGGDWDGSHMQDAIRDSGLAEWREATQEDIIDSGIEDIEVGDAILVLTDAGRKAVTAARADKTGRST